MRLRDKAGKFIVLRKMEEINGLVQDVSQIAKIIRNLHRILIAYLFFKLFRCKKNNFRNY